MAWGREVPVCLPDDLIFVDYASRGTSIRKAVLIAAWAKMSTRPLTAARLVTRDAHPVFVDL
jgi:hypothetical protein